jgi:hypothetical protein
MVTLATALTGLRRVTLAAGTVVAVVCIGLAVTDPALAWVLLPAVFGGAMFGGILIAARGHGPEALERGAVPGGQLATVMNISHIQVAGVGGLFVVVMALIVAAQFAFTAVALGAAVVGGVFVALALIRYRRRHPTKLLHV